jgi:hypothetical protein
MGHPCSRTLRVTTGRCNWPCLSGIPLAFPTSSCSHRRAPGFVSRDWFPAFAGMTDAPELSQQRADHVSFTSPRGIPQPDRLPHLQGREGSYRVLQKSIVVFILADDSGWSDTTFFGTTKFYKTPNIERLAKRGMTFTRAYSSSPLCSPTRASVLTGLNPARTGITAPACHRLSYIDRIQSAGSSPSSSIVVATVNVSGR